MILELCQTRFSSVNAKGKGSLQVFRTFPFPVIQVLVKNVAALIAYGNEFLTREFFREITTFISRHPSFHDFFRNCVKADSRVSMQQYIIISVYNREG